MRLERRQPSSFFPQGAQEEEEEEEEEEEAEDEELMGRAGGGEESQALFQSKEVEITLISLLEDERKTSSLLRITRTSSTCFCFTSKSLE